MAALWSVHNQNWGIVSSSSSQPHLKKKTLSQNFQCPFYFLIRANVSNCLAMFSEQRIPPECWTKMKPSEECTHRCIKWESFNVLLFFRNSKNNHFYIFFFFKRLTSFLSKFLSFKCCILVLILKVLPTADVFMVMDLFCCSVILPIQEPSTAGDGEKGGWFHLC